MTVDHHSWIENFKVRSYELSPDRELSAPSLCNYLQEAASRHAQELGVSIDHLAQHQLTWVLARLDLVILEPTHWRDEVLVETWPSKMRGFVARREFLVRLEDRIAARATSAWLVIDLAKRRPSRLPPALLRIIVPDRPPALPRTASSLPRMEDSPAGDLLEQRFEVGYGDLDINRHVNHVSYIEWALESLPTEFHEGHRLVELEADFRSEIHYPAEVVAKARRVNLADGISVVHGVGTSGGEAARLRTRWTPESE